MMILNTTAALIDEIVERGLVPIEYRSMYGGTCVACDIAEIEETLDVPQMDAFVTHCIAFNGRRFVVYWPAAHWDEHVAEYVATISDPSGVANATAPVAGNT